jgi:hypothetical protein
MRDVESGLHVIWSCPAAQDVWGGGSVLFQKCAFMGDSFLQLVDYCIDQFTKADMSLMTIISRRIWLRRNKFIFENNFTHPHMVFKEAVDSLDEFFRYNSKEEESVNINGASLIHRSTIG